MSTEQMESANSVPTHVDEDGPRKRPGGLEIMGSFHRSLSRTKTDQSLQRLKTNTSAKGDYIDELFANESDSDDENTRNYPHADIPEEDGAPPNSALANSALEDSTIANSKLEDSTTADSTAADSTLQESTTSNSKSGRKKLREKIMSKLPGKSSKKEEVGKE